MWPDPLILWFFGEAAPAASFAEALPIQHLDSNAFRKLYSALVVDTDKAYLREA